MVTPWFSGTASSDESDATMDCRLVLTTLSGKEVQVSTSIAQHDRFEDFEEHIVDHLASVTEVEVFGCEVDFVHPVTQEFLEEHIWEAIQQTKHYNIVFRDCFDAGTRYCVQYLIQPNTIALVARLGERPPCPLLLYNV